MSTVDKAPNGVCPQCSSRTLYNAFDDVISCVNCGFLPVPKAPPKVVLKQAEGKLPAVQQTTAMSTVNELVALLEEAFPNRLPLIAEQKANPEAIWLRLGEQRVMDKLRRILKGE